MKKTQHQKGRMTACMFVAFAAGAATMLAIGCLVAAPTRDAATFPVPAEASSIASARAPTATAGDPTENANTAQNEEGSGETGSLATDVRGAKTMPPSSSENDNNNIGNKTFGIVLLYTPNIASYAYASSHLIRQYCSRHNYAFLEHTARLTDDTARSAPWDKLLAVAKYLDALDVVVWMDADVFITNPAVRLDAVLFDSHPSSSFWFSYDAGPWDFDYYTNTWLHQFGGVYRGWDAGLLPNTGVMAFRGEKSNRTATASRRLLSDAWDVPSNLYEKLDPQAKIKDKSDPYFGWPWEQGGIWYALNTNPEHRERAAMLHNRAMNSFPEQIYGTQDLAVHFVGMTRTRKANFAWTAVAQGNFAPWPERLAFGTAEPDVAAALCCPGAVPSGLLDEELRLVSDCLLAANAVDPPDSADLTIVAVGATGYATALLRGYASHRGYGFVAAASNESPQSCPAEVDGDDGDQASDGDLFVLDAALAAVEEQRIHASSNQWIVAFNPDTFVADSSFDLQRILATVAQAEKDVVILSTPSKFCEERGAPGALACLSPILAVRSGTYKLIEDLRRGSTTCDGALRRISRARHGGSVAKVNSALTGMWPFYARDNSPGGTFRPPLLSTAGLPPSVRARFERAAHAATCARGGALAGLYDRSFDALFLGNVAADGLRDAALFEWESDEFAAGAIALAHYRRYANVVSPADDGGTGGAALTTWACELAQDDTALGTAYRRAAWSRATAGEAMARADQGWLLLQGVLDADGGLLALPLAYATCAAHLPPGERYAPLAELASAEAVSLGAKWVDSATAAGAFSCSSPGVAPASFWCEGGGDGASFV